MHPGGIEADEGGEALSDRGSDKAVYHGFDAPDALVEVDFAFIASYTPDQRVN